MVLDKLLAASYKGIQFHIEEARDEISWNHQTNEYITGEDASTVRFSAAARSFQVSGFLLGRDANLTKDLLVGATDSKEPGNLIHPLYGIKNVVCVSRKFTTLGVSAFRFQMDFKEAADTGDKGILDDVASELDRVNAAIIQNGLKFYSYMGKILEASYLLNEAAKTLEKLDSFVESANGLAIIPRSLGSILGSADRVVALIKKPQRLYQMMVNSSASIVQKGSVSRFASTLSEGGLKGFITANFTGLLLAEVSKNEGPLDMDVYASLIDNFMNANAPDEGKPISKDLFPLVWSVQQRLVKMPLPRKRDLKPSLVTAYEEYGDLTKERELANEAGQPFRV